MIIIPEEEGEFEQKRKRKNKSSLRVKGKVMAESKVVFVIKILKKLLSAGRER